MRLSVLGVASALALAGCSQQSSESADGPMATEGKAAADVAFTYFYGLRLPATRISTAQDGHADACERLGADRCRITGMSYNVDDGGNVDASLTVAVERSIARRFGREGVKAVENSGGALVRARIDGTSAAEETTGATTARGDSAADLSRIDAQLARTDLDAAERAELQRQRAELVAGGRTARDTAASARGRLAATPITFGYESGSGVGIGARLADAWELAAASATTTLIFVLQALAILGPPLLLVLLFLWLWLRWGIGLWRRWMKVPSE